MKFAAKKYLPEKLFTTRQVTTLFVKNAGKKSSWSARGAEILFLEMKRIKASTDTSASVVTMIYSTKREKKQKRKPCGFFFIS